MRHVIPLMLASILALPSAASAQVELIANGGFESGALGPWTTTGLGSPTGTCPIEERDFNVSTTGFDTGCTPVGLPRTGSFAAYNMFDGDGPLTYRLTQSFLVPTGLTHADLAFWTSVAWSHVGEARRFSAGFIDPSMAFTSVFDFFSTPDTPRTDIDWFGTGLDVTGALTPYQGQMVSLAFEVEIPEEWTGPAGLGLDDVSLTARTEAVPEPATVILLGTGLLGLGVAARRRRRREDIGD